MVKNLPASARVVRDLGSVPGLGRSPGGGRSNPLQYSSLENLMEEEPGGATAHEVAKSRTHLKQLSRHTRTLITTVYISLLLTQLPHQVSWEKINVDQLKYNSKKLLQELLSLTNQISRQTIGSWAGSRSGGAETQTVALQNTKHFTGL